MSKTKITIQKARLLIARAKVEHLKQVLRRNKARWTHVLFNNDWETEAEIEYWENYINGLVKD